MSLADHMEYLNLEENGINKYEERMAENIRRDPQKHMDALVSAGVVRRGEGIVDHMYFVVPPKPKKTKAEVDTDVAIAVAKWMNGTLSTEALQDVRRVWQATS